MPSSRFYRCFAVQCDWSGAGGQVLTSDDKVMSVWWWCESGEQRMPPQTEARRSGLYLGTTAALVCNQLITPTRPRPHNGSTLHLTTLALGARDRGKGANAVTFVSRTFLDIKHIAVQNTAPFFFFVLSSPPPSHHPVIESPTPHALIVHSPRPICLPHYTRST